MSLAMFPSRIESEYCRVASGRIHQGDILRDLKVPGIIGGEQLTVSVLTLPYSVVMTQDCDLEWDFVFRNDSSKPTHDKYLQSILLCPAYPGESLKLGEHLKMV